MAETFECAHCGPVSEYRRFKGWCMDCIEAEIDPDDYLPPTPGVQEVYDRELSPMYFAPKPAAGNSGHPTKSSWDVPFIYPTIGGD